MVIVTLRSLLVGLVASALLTPAARAGEFQASPVKVFLDGKSRSALVTIANRSQTPLRLQLDAFAWSETERGEQSLSPTDEVVVFPSLLELGPMETRTIRVGTTVPAAKVERTYRVIIEELPPEDTNTNGVALRMRMSLPVFVVEGLARSAVAIENPSLDKGRTLSIAMKNIGMRHLKPTAIEVTFLRGETRHVGRIPGWYLLVGQRRIFELPTPADLPCVESVIVKVEAEEEGTQKSFTVSDPGCARSPERAPAPR